MKRFNKVFVFCTIILLLIVIFIDNDSLNSLFINYSDIVVDEVAVLNVDYNTIIYNNANVIPTNSVISSDNGIQNVNKVVSSNSWTWPTDQNYTITTYYSSAHKAIDIYSYTGNGSNIYAANNGTVSMVMGGCSVGDLGCNGRGGNYVVINHHNNYYTVYMHLKEIRVRVGDVVSRGQVIATMGNTGNVIPVPTASSPYLGTHLHFCLYVGEPFKGGNAINPMILY